MLSYKEYKQLNESLYGAFNLGLKQPNVVSGVIGATGESEVVEAPSEEGNDLEEAKKCGMAMEKGMKHDHEEKEEKDHDHKKKEDHDEEKDEKDEEKDEKDHEEKGLTAAQKKLPEALQKAILKKKKGSKKEWTEVMADVESLLEDVKNQSVIDAVRNAMNQVKDSMTTRELSEEEKAWWNSVNSQLG